MATREVKLCDVFSTVKDIKTHRILLLEAPTEGGSVEELTKSVTGLGFGVTYNRECDLSPRAVKRVKHRMEKCTDPPQERKAADDPEPSGAPAS